MRVIAGQFKNRPIHSLKGEWLRPTTDRTREFIFSWLGNLVPGARVLDLFAGTGALGIEAMSRGAQSVSFVDNAPSAVALIKRNAAALAIEAKIYRQETLAFLKMAGKMGWQYDLIFCDPPYSYRKSQEILGQLCAGRVVESRGLLVFEASSRETLACPAPWQMRKVKVMGDTQILFYGLTNDQENCDLPGIVRSDYLRTYGHYQPCQSSV